MTFMFRHRFEIADGNRIGHPEHELVLNEGPVGRVTIRPAHEDLDVADEQRFALRGECYPTEDVARAEGERWVHALALGCVAELTPANLESRSPRGGTTFSQSFLRAAADAVGAAVRLYGDEPGLLVVPEDPAPLWGRIEASGTVVRNAPATVAAIRRAYDERLQPDERTMLAYDLYCAAESVAGDADARFLMLMSAVEALIERVPREGVALDLVQSFAAQLGDRTDIEPGDRASLQGAIKDLRSESISAAGRKLASTLDPRQYGEQSAADFFRRAYGVRSSLVHSSVGAARPSIDTVRDLYGSMVWFVRDLILARAGAASWPHPLDR